MSELSREQLLELYRQMVTIRFFEIQLSEESKAGNIRGSLHLATGQEALPAGACFALSKEDSITMTYRGHGYALAKGCDINLIAAEILGREAGLCKGKGGKMHLFDPENGVLGANGIVAGGIPTALGAAFAAKTLKTGAVSLTVFGDGALNQGVASECLNLAALWRLPVIFLCENNLYAEMTPLEGSSKETKLTERAKGFGLPVIQIDGNDPIEVYKAVSQAKRLQSAFFIEALTYRTCGHYHLDPGYGSYRTKQEVEKSEAASPISRFSSKLQVTKVATLAELEKIEKEASEVVTKAFEFARNSPEASPETALTGVFA